MNPPRYERRCAYWCKDAKGAPRPGTQWIHIWGLTRWVCQPCANRIFQKAGLERRRPHTAAERPTTDVMGPLQPS